MPARQCNRLALASDGVIPQIPERIQVYSTGTTRVAISFCAADASGTGRFLHLVTTGSTVALAGI